MDSDIKRNTTCPSMSVICSLWLYYCVTGPKTTWCSHNNESDAMETPTPFHGNTCASMKERSRLVGAEVERYRCSRWLLTDMFDLHCEWKQKAIQ